jgi:hypothetical protein
MSPRSGQQRSSKPIPVTATGSSSARSAAALRRGERTGTAAASSRQLDGAAGVVREGEPKEGGRRGGDLVFERTEMVTETTTITTTMSWMERNRWVVYALASGACAAFNGVFAKL